MTRPAPAGSSESLRRADSLRMGTGAARSEALSIYRENAGAIDPASAEGELRVRWLLESRSALAPEFEELILRASVRAGDEGTRFSASLASAQFPQRRGDFKSAEKILRRALASVRGTRSRRETSASMQLCGVFRAQHREFEALVMSRRASGLAERLGLAGAQAAALVHLAATLLALSQHAAFDAAAAKLEALLPSLDAHEAVALRRPLHRHRADSFVERGDHAAAEREIALRDALPIEKWMRNPIAMEDAHRRARVLLAEGRQSEALDVVAAHHMPGGPRGPAWFEWCAIEIGCRSRLGAPNGIDEPAQVFLAEIERTGVPLLGTNAALRLAASAGSALGAAQGCGSAALRAQRFSAVTMHERTEELDACIRDLDELSASAEEDGAMLAEFRQRFVREEEALLATIAARG